MIDPGTLPFAKVRALLILAKRFRRPTERTRAEQSTPATSARHVGTP
jgi:hypothetical protein